MKYIPQIISILLLIYFINVFNSDSSDSAPPTSNDTVINTDEYYLEEPDANYVDPDVYYPESNYFNGYPCTTDCSGHEAGYEWAESNGIEDPSDCGGNSQSFIEGCESYAEQFVYDSYYEGDYVDDSNYYEDYSYEEDSYDGGYYDY